MPRNPGQTRIAPPGENAPFGTLGGLVEAASEGGSSAPRRFLLTAAHVLAPTSGPPPASMVLDAETREELSSACRANDPLSGALDIGIAELTAPVEPEIAGIGIPVNAGATILSDAQLGEGEGTPLRVFGAGSRRLVASRLIRSDATATIRYLNPANDERLVQVTGHYLIAPEGLVLGDSGAFVLVGGSVIGVFIGFAMEAPRLGVVVPIGAALAEASRLAGVPLTVVQRFDGIVAALAEAKPVPDPGAPAGQGSPYGPEDVAAALARLGFDPGDWPLLAAVLKVESSGFGFLADRRPKILFERHVFSRETGHRFDTVDSNISSRTSGGYLGGAAEHDRLRRAIELCRGAGLGEEPALKSASWGIGQVMGFNHRIAGFPENAAAMVAAFSGTERAQLMSMVAFIVGNGLAAPLRDQDWRRFARGYNGAAFEAHGYHLKLAAAFARAQQDRLIDVKLRQEQAALLYLGHLAQHAGVDGENGPRTQTAIMAWRSASGRPGGPTLDAADHAALLAEVGF